MKRIYLDNAATTPIDPEVIELMTDSMHSNFGNPSSTHQFGRTAKSAVETARKHIAQHFNVSVSELIFTAGGTEADNLILSNAVTNLGVKTIITSKIEHHAVLHTIDYLKATYSIIVDYVAIDASGNVDLGDLDLLLKKYKEQKCLVSLMCVNNEIGNLLPLDQVVAICKAHGALFHSDTVQAIGHYAIDLHKTPIDFIAASAHKFHGPKGVGFAYFKKGFGISPILHGGNQEKGARSSTENVHSILGMEKALEIALTNLEKDTKYLKELKQYLITQLQKSFSDVTFNGNSENIETSSYTILNVRFPINDSMLLFQLDLAGIAVSGGSACQSGSNQGSHVLAEILDAAEAEKTAIRFSFNKHNNKAEIDFVVKKLAELLNKQNA